MIPPASANVAAIRWMLSWGVEIKMHLSPQFSNSGGIPWAVRANLCYWGLLVHVYRHWVRIWQKAFALHIRIWESSHFTDFKTEFQREKKQKTENRALLILAFNKWPEGGITTASWHNLGKGKRNQVPRGGFSFGAKPMVCGEMPACSQQKWNQGLRGSM